MPKRFRAALAFLGPNAWGPLAVGIATAGVVSDFALRPAVETGIESVCSSVTSRPEVKEAMGVKPDGVCKSYIRQQQANTCLSEDKKTLEYVLKNPDETQTKWVANVDPNGKLTGLKELVMDSEQQTVLKAPIEYRFQGEDLAEVRPTPTSSIRSNALDPHESQTWASYSLIASVMRTAVASCQPGKYDELLRSAQAGLRMPPHQDVANLQKSERFQLRRNSGPYIRNQSL